MCRLHHKDELARSYQQGQRNKVEGIDHGYVACRLAFLGHDVAVGSLKHIFISMSFDSVFKIQCLVLQGTPFVPYLCVFPFAIPVKGVHYKTHMLHYILQSILNTL